MNHRTPAVMILTDDRLLDISRTSHYLGLACKRIGTRAFVRDTSDDHWLCEFVQKHKFKASQDIGELMITSEYVPFIFYAGVSSLLSLNAHWVFPPESFIGLDDVKNIHSIWLDDLRCFSSQIKISEERSFQEAIAHSKVRHYFSNTARMKEGELLGLQNRKILKPAAPAEFLKENFPCKHHGKIAFLGGPGTTRPPTEKVVKEIQNGCDFNTLRQLAMDEILENPRVKNWEKQEPEIRQLIAETVEAKIASPGQSALELLHQTGNQHPRALEMLKKEEKTLEAAVVIKEIFRYDRPAMIRRLHLRGWLDVHGSPDEWQPYGIQARPRARSCELAEFYQSYPCHLNIPNATQEATVNEKLFESAACGRVSVVPRNSDIENCFDLADEIVCFDGIEELEKKILELIEQTDSLLNKGGKAHMRVDREHTWDHRLKEIFAGAAE